MPGSISPTIRRLELAAGLREARREAHQTLAAVGRALRYSAPTISRFETGERLPREQDVRMMCRLYGITDEERVEHLVELLRQAEDTGWWEDFDVSPQYQKFIGLEAAATSIQVLDALRVPALAMTKDYSDAMLAMWNFSPEDLENRRKILLIRQQILERPDPPNLQMIIDEAVLRRQVGGRRVMEAQVAKLHRLNQRPNVDLRVIPFTHGAHFGLNGAFTLLRLPGRGVEGTVYIDELVGQFFFDSPQQLQRYEKYFASLWQSDDAMQGMPLRPN